jgi:hypothetical protein
MPAPGFSFDSSLHLIQRLRRTFMRHATENLIGLRWGKQSGGLQQHTFRRILNNESGTGVPMPAPPNFHWQDDLPFGGQSRSKFV